MAILYSDLLVGSLKMNTTLEYSTRVVQEGDRRCKKSTLNDLAYLTPLRIPLMNPVYVYGGGEGYVYVHIVEGIYAILVYFPLLRRLQLNWNNPF